MTDYTPQIRKECHFEEMEMIMKYCEVIAKAPAYAAMGGLPGIFAVVMSAKEYGVSPMAALNGGLYLIPPKLDKDGKAKGCPLIILSARTMNALILRSGHIIEMVEQKENSITLKGTRKDTGISLSVTMTLEMARKAGLGHDMNGRLNPWSTWAKNPDDMLWKTCLTKLARRLFADVIGNAYVEAEFEEKKDDNEIINEREPKKELKKIKSMNITVNKAYPPEKKQQITFNVHEEENEKQSENEQLQDQENQSIEDFCKELKLIEGDPEYEDSNLIAYVNLCAVKFEKSWSQMIEYCMINKEKFMQSYKKYAVKEGIIQDEDKK